MTDVRRCPICGAAHETCGPIGAPITPVGASVTYPKEDPMALAEYDVVINGQPTTALLTPEHAARLGAKPVGAKATEAPTKARTAQNKAG